MTCSLTTLQPAVEVCGQNDFHTLTKETTKQECEDFEFPLCGGSGSESLSKNHKLH